MLEHWQVCAILFSDNILGSSAATHRDALEGQVEASHSRGHTLQIYPMSMNIILTLRGYMLYKLYPEGMKFGVLFHHIKLVGVLGGINSRFSSVFCIID